MASAKSSSPPPSRRRCDVPEDVVERFEVAWQSGPPPALEEFVRANASRNLLIELVHIDLEYRLKAGDAVRVESYLDRFPNLRDSRKVVLDLIAAEFRLRKRREPVCEAEEYFRRFPHFSDELVSSMPSAGSTRYSLDPVPAPGITKVVPSCSTVAYVAPGSEWLDNPAYEILHELGKGGMGVVYLARETQLHRLVAIKRIKAGFETDPAEQELFRHEARAVARLQHPNIVQIHRVDESRGQPYFVLEYVAGGSLHGRLRGVPQPPAEAAALVEVLARAMNAAHRAGVVHRDLKPANILLSGASAEGSAQTPLSQLVPKITDFGLAKRLDEKDALRSGVQVGTPAYMAPEQARGRNREVGPAADTWALGAILYECLTGRPPFHGSTAHETLDQVLQQEPVPVRALQPRCPRDLETICLKCLEKATATRYQTADDLAADLRRFLEGRPILARRASVGERLVKWARRSPWQAAALAMSAALLVVLVGFLHVSVRAAWHEAEMIRSRSALSDQFTNLYLEAHSLAHGADPADVKKWTEVAGLMRTAMALAKNLPNAKENSVYEQAVALSRRAEAILHEAEECKRHGDPVKRLSRHHAEATYFATLNTILRLAPKERATRVREAAQAGLELFGVHVHGAGPPTPPGGLPLDDRMTADCVDLLLLDAEELAQAALAEQGSAREDLLRQALARVDRAGRLRPEQSRAICSRRAHYLELLGKHDAASATRREAERLPARFAEDHFLAGMEHFHRGQWGKARESLQQALAFQPGHFGAEYVLGTCQLYLKERDKAIETLTRCLTSRPDFAWARLQRGVAKMESDLFAAAAQDFAHVLANPPDEAAHHVGLLYRGLLEMRQEEWEQATASFQEAIKVKRDSSAGYVNLAVCLRESVADLSPEEQRPTLRQAVAVLKDGIGQVPEVASLLYERGQFYRQLGEFLLAEEDLRQAVALDRESGEWSVKGNALEALGRVRHRLGKNAEAVTAYRRAMAERPNDVELQRLLAEPLIQLGNYTEAAVALDRYLKAPKGLPESLAAAHKMRGLVHAARQQLLEAIASFTRALDNQRDAETLTERGRAFLWSNSVTLALVDLDAALMLQPDAPEALLLRGEARVRIGQVDKGLADVNAALARKQVQPTARHQAARTYAFAALVLRKQAAGERDQLARAAAHEKSAAALLLAWVREVPAEKRVSVWRHVVEKDPVLSAVRAREEFRDLAATKK